MANFRDIYIKSEEDPGFRPDQVEVYDELEAVLQQIKMTLFTNKGEVLGEPDFGLQVEKYLFEFSVNPFLLTNEDKYNPDPKICIYFKSSRINFNCFEKSWI